MKNAYLLDTHILLWWLFNDKRLTKDISILIANPDLTIFVSIATIWEIAIKKSLKKVTAPNNLIEIIESNNIKILAITAHHVLQTQYLPLIHKDPFDRLLIAQTAIEGVTFVTADTIIQKYNITCY
jgi:PIN domain nuclease of toxin-antitoxin system